MNKKDFLDDSSGNKSSKRLWGTILLTCGILISLVLFFYSLVDKAADASTALGIVNIFLISGSGLLGIGVFENKLNKNDN